MPYTADSKNLPDYIKKLKKSLREAWANAWNSSFKKFKDESKAFKYANGVIKKIRGIGMEKNFELHAEFEKPRELTENDVKGYGLDPSLLQKPNFKVFEGDLALINTEFMPETEGMNGYKKFFITEDSVKKALPGLSNTPIHITGTDFKGHSVVDPKTGERKYISIGTYLGGKIIKDGDDRICRVLGGLWEDDYAKETKAISEKKDELGQSFEIRPNLETLEEIDSETANIHDFVFKGGAILLKDLAAFPQTQLLVAQKVVVGNPEEVKKPKIQIVSDGTKEGTKFLLDGEEIPDLRSFNFSTYEEDKNLSCSFTTKVKGVDDFVKEERYYLDKNELKIESVDGKPAGRNIPNGGKGLGLGGKCVCPKCGAEAEHKTADPCYKMVCPKCGAKMTRKTGVKGGESDLDNEGLEMWFPEISSERWTKKTINDLPNSAFAVVEPDYLSEKTDNKNARHLPYKGADGKIDLPHLRNALARVNQVDPITEGISAEELRARAKKELTRVAKQYLPDSKWAKEGGVKGMEDKTYTQAELDKALDEQKKEFEGGKVLAGKDGEITTLTAKVKELDDKIVADTKATKEKTELDAKTAKEKDAQVAAEKWFDDNKDAYPESKKDELIAIRKKIELGEVKKEEIEKLLAEKKGVKIEGTGLLNLNEDNAKMNEKQLDTLFGISDASKVNVA